MKKKLQTKARLLAVVMLFALVLTACTQTPSNSGTSAPDTSGATSAASTSPANNTTAPDVNAEPAKLTMFMGTAGITIPDGVDIADNPYFNRIQELANVEITELTVPAYADFATKLTLMLSSNQIPDIVHNWQLGEAGKAGAAGAFMDMEPIIESSPVFSSKYDEQMRNLMRYSDGKIYYLRTQAAPDPACISADLKAVNELNDGVVPTTLDEWYDLFVKQKAANPDSVPVSEYNGISATLLSIFRAHGVQVSSGGAWQYTFGEYIPSLAAPHMTDAILYIKKLYDENLLSKTFVTNTQQDFLNDKLTRGVVYSANGFSSVTINSVNKDDPSVLTIPAPFPTTGYADIDPINSTPAMPTLASHNVAISSRTKELDACVRFIETLMSDEVAELSVWGIEGTDYEVIDGEKTAIVPASTDNYYRRIFAFMFTYNTEDAVNGNIRNTLNTYLTDETLKSEMLGYIAAGKEKIFAAAATVPSITPTHFVTLSEEGVNKATEAAELNKTIILRAITGEISMEEFEVQRTAFIEKYQSVTDEYNAKLAEVNAKYDFN